MLIWFSFDSDDLAHNVLLKQLSNTFLRILLDEILFQPVDDPN